MHQVETALTPSPQPVAHLIPTPAPPTPAPAPPPVPTRVVTGVSADSSGIYYGDSSIAEETESLYMVDPWYIMWKCADTTGSIWFTVDDVRGDIIQTFRPYPCSTTVQKITVHLSGFVKIGSIPLDMDGPYYYGVAHS